MRCGASGVSNCWLSERDEQEAKVRKGLSGVNINAGTGGDW